MPLAFVERLCALIWKPRVSTVRYHGVVASSPSWRAEGVPQAAAAVEGSGAEVVAGPAVSPEAPEARAAQVRR